MDPNEALKKCREAIKEAHAAILGPVFDRAMFDHAADKLISGFGDLDGWLNKGGFLPDDWGKASCPRCGGFHDHGSKGVSK